MSLGLLQLVLSLVQKGTAENRTPGLLHPKQESYH